MHIIWRAIRMLEMSGLTVIYVVADGCSTNRKFFRLHRIPDYQKSGVTYPAPNISSPGNQVYFMADAPHVLKTVRNAWYNSRTNGTRNLVVITNIKCHFAYVSAIVCRTMEVKLNGHT